jgi:zinc protease
MPAETNRTALRRRLLGGALALCAALPALAAVKVKKKITRSGKPAKAAKAPEAEAPRRNLPSVLAPMVIHERRLTNGLQVLALPSPGAATVTVQVWYRVGGKDDPVGRSGFAHLFEHMMFKRTKYLANEQFDRLTEDVGGENNAFTAEDTTAYHSVVPANHLERLLWAEAERMAHLEVDQASFDSERAVVEEELRQRVLASPYGRLFNALAGAAFEVHPYKRPVIGSIEDLDAATLADVQAFHSTYYRPDNATLIVAGGFDNDQLGTWVDRYFGPLGNPATPVPRVRVVEPRRTSPRHVAVHAPNVPLPAVALIWQAPAAGHPDAAALQVAAALLASGESSRLNESLVYREQVAQAAGFSAELYADAGMLVAYGIAASGQPLSRIEAGLMREIGRLAASPPRPDELDKVRSQLLTSAIAERQTPSGRAMSVGWAVIQRGDANAANRAVDELSAVTAADVQKVLKRYIVDGKRVSLTYTAEAKPPAASPTDKPASAPAASPPATAPAAASPTSPSNTPPTTPPASAPAVAPPASAPTAAPVAAPGASS